MSSHYRPVEPGFVRGHGRSRGDRSSVFPNLAQEILLDRPNGKNVRSLDSAPHNLNPDLGILLDNLVFAPITRRRRIGVKFHFRVDQVGGDKDLERADHGKEAHLVDIHHFGIHHLTLEGLHDHGCVSAFEPSLTSRREDFALSNLFGVDYGNDVAVFTAARPLDILVQLLLQVILQLGAKIRRVKEDGVRQLENVEHVVRRPVSLFVPLQKLPERLGIALFSTQPRKVFVLRLDGDLAV